MTAGDANGDGLPDLVVTLDSPYRVAILFNRGSLARLDVEPGSRALGPLARVSPNPARGRFDVGFSLSESAPVALEVIDLLGRRVLARDEGVLGPGVHALDVARGHPLAPGLYFVRLTAGSRTLTAKAIVLR